MRAGLRAEVRPYSALASQQFLKELRRHHSFDAKDCLKLIDL